MNLPPRRTLIAWSLRLLLGVALGWSIRVVYERRPLVRFATGMAVRSMSPLGEEEAPRGTHLRDGQPHFFSLDQIMAAADPVMALRAWREGFQQAPNAVRQRVLEARAEVSIGALRQLLMLLPRSPALRDELDTLLKVATEFGANLYDPDTLMRSLMELARLDAGLALDGAEAIEHEAAVRMVWAIIAEDHPEHVIKLAQAGQAPPETMHAALAGLAATDLARANALILEMPEKFHLRAFTVLADVLAHTRPLEAVVFPGENGKPDPDWANKIISRVPGPQATDFLLGLERLYPELMADCAYEVNKLLQREAARQPGFVLEWSERRASDGVEINAGMESALAAAAAHDPERAAAVLQNWRGEGTFARRRITGAWMQRDPIAAVEWMSAQPNAAAWMRNTGWEHVRPEQAPVVAEWLATSGNTEISEGLGRLVDPWVRHDPAGAVAWANQLPPGADRFLHTSVAAVAAAALIKSQAPQADALIESLVRASPESLAAVIRQVPGGRGRLGDAVAASLPDLMEQTGISRELTSYVAGHLGPRVENPSTRAQTLETIASLPDPQHRQSLLRDLTERSKVVSSVPLARALANAMPDEEAANRLVEDAVRNRLR